MSETELFGKLSRIFETHGFLKNDFDQDIENMLMDIESHDENYEEMFDPRSSSPSSPSPGFGTGNYGETRYRTTASDKPTPYEVWVEKNKDKIQAKPKNSKKLTNDQWDRLVEKMHSSNRLKQSALEKDKNQGLAAELGGYLFRPQLNKTSLDLSATMKSLQHRMPEMLAERKKEMEQKRKESEANEIAECTFTPNRQGAQVSALYLQKIGRKKVTPEDLFRYEEERKKRIEMRRQIIQDFEAKNLTFKPQISERSKKLQEKLIEKGVISSNTLERTKTSSIRPQKYLKTADVLNSSSSGGEHYQEGPMLIIESEHPYRNNTSEYTTVHVPGAVSYMIYFDEKTSTKPIFDYIKFYDDDTHTRFYGDGKYSGGFNNSSHNWPGVNGKPGLHIPASRFIIYFKTSGSNNDWGFAMHIIPTLLITNNDPNSDPSGIPYISDAGRSFQHAEKVHERLYKHAIIKQTEHHNTIVENIQNKLNISLKPWETSRPLVGNDKNSPSSSAHSYIKMYNKTHLAKHQLSDIIEDMVISNPQESIFGQDLLSNTWAESTSQPNSPKKSKKVNPFVCVVEYDDSLNGLWKTLKAL